MLVLAEHRYAGQVQPAGLVAAARRHGVPVRYRLIEPTEPARPKLDDFTWADVVVARGRSDELLELVGAAEAAGLPVVDPAGAVRAVRDKAHMAQALVGAGVPTPATYIAPLEELAAAVPDAAYPLILKPVLGDNCRGLRVVGSRGELAASSWPEVPALAQTYVCGDGADIKIYAIGDRLTAIRKPSPFTPPTAERKHFTPTFVPYPVRLTSTLEAVGRRCGALFGLTAYGVDCLDTPAGPVVIEVNDFPNFTAVPRASEELLRHALAAAGTTCAVAGVGR